MITLKTNMVITQDYNSQKLVVQCMKLKLKTSIKILAVIRKCLRHSMSRIESKDHRIGTYEINKISLSCFDDKVYIQNNGCDKLALGYQS